jgi:uncharacterized protein (DUF433 family)
MRMILIGQPTIRGMRVTVRRVIESLAVWPNWDDLCRVIAALEAEYQALTAARAGLGP